MGTKKSKSQPVTLDDIAREKLKSTIVQQIDETEIEIWETIEPGIRVRVTKKYFDLRLKVPTKKLVAYIGGFGGSALIVVKVIYWLIPIIENYSN